MFSVSTSCLPTHLFRLIPIELCKIEGYQLQEISRQIYLYLQLHVNGCCAYEIVSSSQIRTTFDKIIAWQILYKQQCVRFPVNAQQHIGVVTILCR